MSQLSDFEIDIQTKLLRATYLNNMMVLKKHMPELFEFYQNYQPTRAKLTFDHNGDINMVSEGGLVYEEEAKINSYKQAEAYLADPKLFSYNIKFSDSTVNFEHERKLRDLYKKRESEVKNFGFNILKVNNTIDFLTMIGGGLGYHIERLFQLTQVRYFYLYEPDPDCFYCALHCIDFGPLIEGCFKLGGAFTIKVGGNANNYVNGINYILLDQGFFNVTRLFNYRHYHSEATDETYKKVFELSYRLSSGWGFFEDEIISLIHTITNSKAQFPYLINKKLFNNKLKDKPVFIVANGPSLDDDIAYIKANADNAIVFSCGTALKTILDSGIMPDFHIEMERTALLYEWVDSVGHKDKLKQINIIALNTVFTDILKLFKNAYLLPKPKDGGMDFLYSFLDKQKYLPVDCCNPTVSNAATAAVAYLGFDTMYLFGVDLGYIDEEYHHSKGSIYYKKGSHAEKGKMSSEIKVKGNFVDEVFTTHHFDNSRASIEILLENNPDISCYNASNGAYIQLTTPLVKEEFPVLSKIKDKPQLIEELLEDSFSFEELEKLDLSSLFELTLEQTKDIINKVISITSVKITSRLQLAHLFSAQYKYARSFKDNKDTRVIHRFLGGTLNYFQANIMTNAYLYDNETKQLEYIRFGLSIFHEHLTWLYDELEKSYKNPSKI
jgi:hypothetical protein